MNIAPIETVYNGYRFRSRLEARWAVFFDCAGIKYEYEPEGYILPSGRRYLPDFSIVCKGCIPNGVEYSWLVEVKPTIHRNQVSEYYWEQYSESIRRAKEMHKFAPEPYMGLLFFHELKPVRSFEQFLKECMAKAPARVPMSHEEDLQALLGLTRKEFNQAIAAARKARFEFGENKSRRKE